MRALVILLVACSVEVGPRPARYVEPAPPPRWCSIGPGAYAYTNKPPTFPALVRGCGRPATTLGPDRSTFSQLVIDPRSTVEITVGLPDALQGCIFDSIVLVHGRSNDGLAVDVRVGETVTPILTYQSVPGMYAERVDDRLPPDVELYAVRHRLGIAAAPLQTIVLHAEKGFSLGIRSDEESPNDVTLVLDGKPTHHVPQAAIVLTHCRLPAGEALDTLRRTNPLRPSIPSNR